MGIINYLKQTKMKASTLLLTMSSTANVGIDVAQVEQLLAGFINGMVDKDDLPELQKCMTNAEDVASTCTDIFNKIMSGDQNNITAALVEAVTLASQLPTDLQNCENASGDLTKIKDWIVNQDVTKITENVISNIANITMDINTITSDIQNDNYTDAGFQAADLLILALGQINNATLHEEIREDMYLF